MDWKLFHQSATPKSNTTTFYLNLSCRCRARSTI